MSIKVWWNKQKESRRTRYHVVSTAFIMLILCMVLAVNALFITAEKKFGWRLDCSFNALLTTGETTKERLKALEYPVHIYAVFPRGEEDKPLLELLDRYAVLSDKITWERSDLSMNPGLINRFGSATDDLTNGCVIVYCEETKRYKVLSWGDFVSIDLDLESGSYTIGGLAYESKLTSAIVYTEQQDVPRIIMLQGHNELSENDTEVFHELMSDNLYDVLYTHDLTGVELDTKRDMLAMISPVRDITQSELDTIMDFTNHGGSMLFVCDYNDPVDSMPLYASLLRSYGFVPKDGIVVASEREQDSYYNGNRVFLLPQMRSTDMTADLVAVGADVLLLTGARAFDVFTENDRYLNLMPLLTSGEYAYLKVLDADMNMEQNADDETGPFSLALQASKITTDGYISRAVIIGSSSILVSAQIHAMTDSEVFLIRLCEYLLQNEPADLGIAPKTAVRPGLSARSSLLGSVMITILPLSVLAAALIVLSQRKRK